MEEHKRSFNWFKLGLGLLVTVYGIATALVSHQASQLDNSAREMTFVGIMELTKGNDAYAVADAQYFGDYDAITQMILVDQSGGSEAAYQTWEDTLSQEALDALDRSDDLDDQYSEELYEYPNQLYDNASLAYQTAQTYSQAGNQYELITLMLAMGLAFVGWASLLDGVRVLPYLFAGIAFVVLVWTMYSWWQAAASGLPPVVSPLP